MDDKMLAEVKRMVEKEVREAIRYAVVGQTARVATEAEVGKSPLRTAVSLNGDEVMEAQIWLDGVVEPNGSPVWCGIRRGVVLNPGDIVRIVKNYPGAGLWWVDAKL